MNRRQFLYTAAALAVPRLARAAQTCGQPFAYNGAMVRECSAGFQIAGFTAQQRCDQWCWAACCQVAFGLRGYDVPQEAFVQKIFGDARVCRPAIGPQIAQAIHGPWTDRRGQTFFAQVTTHLDAQFAVADPFALQNASRYLANDVPVIIGALGHATLLTGMSWAEDSFGNVQLTELVVRDPWPGTPNRRQLSPRELAGATYMAAVLVT